MVEGDGGSLRVLGVDGPVITVGYRPGSDRTCEGDACVLPEAELQQMMAETLARRDRSLRVEVTRVEEDR